MARTIPPLLDADQVILRAFFNKDPSTERVSAPGMPLVTLASLHTLKPEQWLGDEVINGYMALLTQREFLVSSVSRPHIAISSYFYATIVNELRNRSAIQGHIMAHTRTHMSVRNLAPAKDIFRMATLFIPLHVNGNHWTSIVVDFPNQTITYLDSMGGSGHPHVDRILHFLELEHQAVHKSSLPTWEHVITPTPRQVNNNDCGVYTCFFANRILQGTSIQVSPESISTFREHIAISIVTNTATHG